MEKGGGLEARQYEILLSSKKHPGQNEEKKPLCTAANSPPFTCFGCLCAVSFSWRAPLPLLHVKITAQGGCDDNVRDELVGATTGKIGSLQPDATKQGARVWIVSVIYLFAPLLF